MTTAKYENIKEMLTANRQYVIDEYNFTNNHAVYMANNGMGVVSGWSLKDFMLAVMRFFEEHKGKAKKACKEQYLAMYYLAEAVKDAKFQMSKKVRAYNSKQYYQAAVKGFPYNM